MARSVLFSQQDLADEMADRFECCWVSMGRVPFATIDLGNGQVVEQTIGGNIITWFCLGDGRAFDVQPGLLDVPSYRAALRRAAASHRSLTGGGNDAPESQLAQAIAMAEGESNGWSGYMASQLADLDRSHPLAHGNDAVSRLGRITSPLDVRAEPPALERALVKRIVELSLASQLTPVNESGKAMEGVQDQMLRADSDLARTVLRPQALGLLANAPLSTPAELGPHVYRLVFATDLADPFLSMRPPAGR